MRNGYSTALLAKRDVIGSTAWADPRLQHLRARRLENPTSIMKASSGLGLKEVISGAEGVLIRLVDGGVKAKPIPTPKDPEHAHEGRDIRLKGSVEAFSSCPLNRNSRQPSSQDAEMSRVGFRDGKK